MDPAGYSQWVTIHRKICDVDDGAVQEGFQVEQRLALRGDERHEPRAAPEQPAHLGQFALAPEQGGRLGREVVGASIQGGERGEVRWQVGGDDLEDALWLGQVLEPMPPEVEQADAIGQGVADQHGGRLGEQHLAAVADRSAGARSGSPPSP